MIPSYVCIPLVWSYLNEHNQASVVPQRLHPIMMELNIGYLKSSKICEYNEYVKFIHYFLRIMSPY